MAIRKIVPEPDDFDPGLIESPPEIPEEDRIKFKATVRRDGSITVPAFVRRLMELEPGGEVELELTFSGLTLRPLHEGRDPEQWWFWTEAWQKGEREIDEDIDAGRVTRYESTEEFLAALEAIEAEQD